MPSLAPITPHVFSYTPLNTTQDVVEERSVSGLCGWPPCTQRAQWAVKGASRYRVSLRKHEIYERVESSKVSFTR